ncbi:RNA polymerase sigma factor [Parasulfitobacter algicola]|uniref:RNA polymerase sigma factor n=1 Tax=Parasulfitobacter algicola TaxID=2614809 RepID=A0ABX2IRZ0_9RHOB|nr:RNA polymerase sigma factor [Sulfitobacter algicola]NSX55667.1 RNA polymerase sigma factor [Sulfitobacter algicola]
MLKSTTAELSELEPEILRMARKLTPTKEIAEDCAQDALLAVWSRLQDGADIEQLRSYAYAALRHRCRRKVQKTEYLNEDTLPGLPADTDARLAVQDVLSVIETLPADRAKLLQELIRSEAPYGELAERLNLPIGTVMSRLSRARADLRKALDLPQSSAVTVLLKEDATH